LDSSRKRLSAVTRERARVLDLVTHVLDLVTHDPVHLPSTSTNEGSEAEEHLDPLGGQSMRRKVRREMGRAVLGPIVYGGSDLMDDHTPEVKLYQERGV